MIDTSQKIIEIYSISAEDIKAYIVSKIDNIYVLWIKNPKDRLYRINLRPKEILVIPEIYNYFKKLFKEKQVKCALLKY